MAHHARPFVPQKFSCDEGWTRRTYGKAFGYKGNKPKAGRYLITASAGYARPFDGDYKVYFDCYKKGGKTKLRLWLDKNGDGEYSGNGEFIASSRKLNDECAKNCEDLRGDIIIEHDIVRNYAKGKAEKREFKKAYERDEDCYFFKKKTKEVEKYDEYGEIYHEEKTTKKWYKCEIKSAKIKLRAYYDRELCEKHDDGYGGYEKRCNYSYDCATSFKIDEDYLNNYETAIDFCG